MPETTVLPIWKKARLAVSWEKTEGRAGKQCSDNNAKWVPHKEWMNEPEQFHTLFGMVAPWGGARNAGFKTPFKKNASTTLISEQFVPLNFTRVVCILTKKSNLEVIYGGVPHFCSHLLYVHFLLLSQWLVKCFPLSRETKYKNEQTFFPFFKAFCLVSAYENKQTETIFKTTSQGNLHYHCASLMQRRVGLQQPWLADRDDHKQTWRWSRPSFGNVPMSRRTHQHICFSPLNLSLHKNSTGVF